MSYNIVGTCSKCGGPMLQLTDQTMMYTPMKCGSCGAQPKGFGPVIETELPPSKPQLLNEST